MLQTVDKALAGAIDVVADDLTATMKSIREQGVKATLQDAVQDAAGLVVGGAGTAISSVWGGRMGPTQISTHSGMSSSYADLCAGPGSRSVGGGGGYNGGGAAAFPYVGNAGAAAFPYVPQGGRPGGGSKAPSAPKAGGGFGPGIGIQRQAPQTAAGYNAGGVQVFAKAGAGPQPGGFGFHPLPGHGAPAPAPAAGYGGGYTGAYASSAPPPPSGKEPTIPSEELEVRIEAVRRREAANNKCFDCNAPDPDWASVSFGVLICIECGGHHRQMGTHISRVRSCKMDSWTERQLQVFEHGGNQRLGDFFTANGIDSTVRFQRYHTPAAEWYREAWIKNRIFDREVPPPAQGVVTGPCNAGQAKSSAKAAAPPADLLDMGSSAGPAPKPAAQADLLGFDDGPAPSAASSAAGGHADLLGVGGSGAPQTATAATGGGDLLGLGGAGGSPLGDLDFAAIAANARPPSSALAGFSGTTQPQQNALASLDFSATTAPAPMPGAAAFPGAAGLAAAPKAASLGAMPARAPAMANTLGGGAKLVDPPKAEEEDLFAMACKKFGV